MDDTEGTETGPCTFTVHGLTGPEYEQSTIKELKAKALRHLNIGGKSLGIGHEETAQSLYHNQQLFPQMFPWLFPYGHGGLDNPVHKNRLGDLSHKRHLLMYHDKRFQTDLYFPMIAFNHDQIKSGVTGSYLMAKQKNFVEITNRLLNVDPAVLDDLSERMSNGDKVKPQTDEEKKCFALLDDIDHVGSHVNGSMTSKKYMRNEIWSLISFLGAPSWFITFAPADNHHPLCLYYAGQKIEFDATIKNSDERNRLIARNPVAAARFFDFMVQMFIKHILGVDNNHPGLYGLTDGYYGTVEQQGQLTLHLHMLLWIANSLSPQEVRVRLQDPTSVFRQELINYLEGSHVGEFLSGSMADVRAKVPHVPLGRKGLHDVVMNQLGNMYNRYKDPTLTMPDKPPRVCNQSDCSGCDDCHSARNWWSRFKDTVDDLILRFNVHRCFGGAKRKDKGKNPNKRNMIHAQVKGCLDRDGNCTARFPRPIIPVTVVNEADGSLLTYGYLSSP